MKVVIKEFKGRKSFIFKCPGCNEFHTVNDTWSFNGNIDSPTFYPSIKVTGGPDDIVCHSYITNGKISFLNSDTTHKKAGQTIELPNIEESEL